jgi:hypothetical protein
VKTPKTVYSDTAEELVKRILVLIPTCPEIMTIESPWDLFKVPGFDCNDLGPTLFQVSWALAQARRRHLLALSSGREPPTGAK